MLAQQTARRTKASLTTARATIEELKERIAYLEQLRIEADGTLISTQVSTMFFLLFSRIPAYLLFYHVLATSAKLQR